MAEDKTHFSRNLLVAEKFRDCWNAGLKLPANQFLALYAPNVVWYDHFFRNQLVGHDAIEMLRQRWLGAHDDYSIETVSVEPTYSGAVLQLINKGIFVRDIAPKRYASGKRFACYACYVIKINDQGLVERIDEYQPLYFDEQYYTEGYTLRDSTAVPGA